MAGTKQSRVSGDPQQKQAIHQHTLNPSTLSAAFLPVIKEHTCLNGYEVTTATDSVMLCSSLLLPG